jgi:hypothetical protein
MVQGLHLSETKAEIIKRVAAMLLAQSAVLIGGFFAIIKYLVQNATAACSTSAISTWGDKQLLKF